MPLYCNAHEKGITIKVFLVKFRLELPIKRFDRLNFPCGFFSHSFNCGYFFSDGNMGVSQSAREKSCIGFHANPRIPYQVTKITPTNAIKLLPRKKNDHFINVTGINFIVHMCTYLETNIQASSQPTQFF